MRSAKSFFNGAIARSDLRRYWPVLFLYVGLWLLFLPIPVWNRAAERNPALVNLTELCADTYATAVVLALIFGGIMATAVFSYLMQTRSVGAMHALPQRRGTLFWTHFLTGWAMLAAGNLLVLAVTALTALLGGLALTPALLTWFVVATLLDLIFLALGTLCAMVTGWLLAIPVIYAGVNFLFAAFYLLYSAITQIFYWGYEASGWPGWLDWLTPTVRLPRQVTDSKAVLYGLNDRGFHCYVDRLSSGAWTTLAVYLAVAVLLAAVAYCFYRARHSETAGDAIVFPWLRPVVLYVIALAGGMGLGILLWYMISAAKGLAALLVYQIISGLIVYFGVQMLLHKSFRVFTRRRWLWRWWPSALRCGSMPSASAAMSPTPIRWRASASAAITRCGMWIT